MNYIALKILPDDVYVRMKRFYIKEASKFLCVPCITGGISHATTLALILLLLQLFGKTIRIYFRESPVFWNPERKVKERASRKKRRRRDA